MDLQNQTSIKWIYYQVQGLVSCKELFTSSWVGHKETFAHVAIMDSIRMVLAISDSTKWEVHHIDVKTAFLHGDLEEEIYMR